VYPWEHTGLLDSVPAADKEILIRKLNQAALFLVNSSEDIKKHNTLILATIARAYHKHKYIIKDTMLVINYILSHLHLIKDFEKPGVDAEAEFCALMVQEISEKKL
jgi:hypothetical protein